MGYIKSIINLLHSFGRKNTEELSINIDESDFTILTSGSYKINSKVNKFYGGGDFSFVDTDNTINYWLKAKNTEEILLEKKKKSFFERVAEVLDSLNNIDSNWGNAYIQNYKNLNSDLDQRIILHNQQVYLLN